MPSSFLLFLSPSLFTPFLKHHFISLSSHNALPLLSPSFSPRLLPRSPPGLCFHICSPFSFINRSFHHKVLCALLRPLCRGGAGAGGPGSCISLACLLYPTICPFYPSFLYLQGKRKCTVFLKNIPSFNNLLSTYYMPSTILGCKDTSIKQTSMSQVRTELVPGLPS